MLTPDSKKLLSATIRRLRTQLLTDLRDEAERIYRRSVSLEVARLPKDTHTRRQRLDAWLAERVRTTHPTTPTQRTNAESRFLAEAVEQVAATLLHRLVVLRIMEATRMLRPAVLTGGINSKAVRELRSLAPDLFADENTGYAWLLAQVFDDLSVDLPGLFGDVGLVRLLPLPAATLRTVVEVLDDPGLADIWDDDTTLGWIYQYWNDPRREALDAKIKDGGKIEGHELAAKTQMFTERYMVEWLLQNSLGLQWLALCRKNHWTPEVEPEVLARLDARRVDWRAQRERGDVPLDALMPYSVGELEERWRYFVPQEVPVALVSAVPESLRALKILDPACGSGHFLVIAFGLLTALYEEEARHRGVSWSSTDITRWILEDNLYGIDLDPRAVQIAAAALFLTARRYAGTVTVRRLNLVATAFDLGRLGPDDAAVLALHEALSTEAGVPAASTQKIIGLLKGIEALGSLVKIDQAIDEAIAEAAVVRANARQGVLGLTDLTPQPPLPKGRGGERVPEQVSFSPSPFRERGTGGEVRSLTDKIESFLEAHTHADDLGVRFDGEQLAAGVRFARMLKDGQYDLVVGNPPYQGTGKMADPGPLPKLYPNAKTDLFGMFYVRGLELLRPHGLVGLVTLSNWMSLGSFEDLRRTLLDAGIRLIADFGKAAFTTGGTLISTSATIVGRSMAGGSIALRPHAPDEVVRDDGQPERTHAALLLQRGRYDFDPASFDAIEGRPIVYWWSREFIEEYRRAPKLGEVAPARFGLNTGDNTRFLRAWSETSDGFSSRGDFGSPSTRRWAAYIKGAEGRSWIEPLQEAIRWEHCGLEVKVLAEDLYGSFSRQIRNESSYWQPGIAFTLLGQEFSARTHRYPSVIDSKGSSVFPARLADTVCLMNRRIARDVLASLNPTVSFQVGDVNRLPLFPVESADTIFATIERAFTEHEAARENSVEFVRPGPSPWRYAQTWAQSAVDRPKGTPLPVYTPVYDAPPAAAWVSYGVGVALGRFAGGEHTLPAGILYLSAARERDSLDDPACATLHAMWAEHGGFVAPGSDLRTYLRRDFFAHHKDVYENRPIWWPLSSAKKTFVAWVSIHRFNDRTLATLLADYLLPERRSLEGELDDLRKARQEGDKGARARAERRYADAQKHVEELKAFIFAMTACAEGGAPAVDKAPTRETDAPYAMDLDDGVMVNASALWPLLEPQWKDPKKWWRELCSAEGRKDYDWSHLAARYFPERVMEKCKTDPSLAVAHGCFWRLHPARAYAWESRLQDEIRPDFTIDERDAGECRAMFLAAHPDEALAIQDKEKKRRERKQAKDDEAELPLETEETETG